MVGAQAQLLSAAQISLSVRTDLTTVQDVDDALWKERTLARAWCMRRTMFLVPSRGLAVFARGTVRRPEHNLRGVLSRVDSEQQFERLLDCTMEILKEPCSRSEIARLLKSQGYRLRPKAGGGWGNSRSVPWVEVGGTSLSIGFLLHLLGARHVICSGPNQGAESTYVRADKWLPDWRDVPQLRAEEELLTKYLGAYGPATVNDFALWVGMYVRDAKEIWARAADRIALVEVEGSKAGALQVDLPELERAKIDGPIVRLLPFFDSYLLGHKSHLNLVGERDRKKVYRNQGWVSPVVLVDGRAHGTWAYLKRDEATVVNVTPFSALPKIVVTQLKDEASRLGHFLGCPNVKLVVSRASRPT